MGSSSISGRLRSIPRRAAVRLPVLVLVLVVPLLGAAGAGPSSADPYVGPVRSACSVDLALADRGERRLSVTVRVLTAGNFAPPGDVTVVLSGRGRTLLRTTRPYDGGTLTVAGPVAPGPGTYHARVTFAPRGEDSATACRAQDRLRAGVGGTGADGDDPDAGGDGVDGTGAGAGGTGEAGGPAGGVAADSGGVLPDTGGVPVSALALAALLIAAGAGLLRLGVRRRGRREPVPLLGASS